VVIRAPAHEQAVDLVGPVPAHPPGSSLRHRQPWRGDLPLVVGARAQGLAPRATLQRFLGELPEGLAGGPASAARQEQRANQPRGALELHPAPASGTFREEDAFVFQERGDARDLLSPVLARLQSSLLKQHTVSHYHEKMVSMILETSRSAGASMMSPSPFPFPRYACLAFGFAG
jgi:hypothetical protein